MPNKRNNMVAVLPWTSEKQYVMREKTKAIRTNTQNKYTK